MGRRISSKWPHNPSCLLPLEAWNSPRVLAHSENARTQRSCLKASIQPRFLWCYKNLYCRPIIFSYHIIGTHFEKLNNLVSIMTSARGLHKLDSGSLFASFACQPLHWNSTWFNDLSVLPYFACWYCPSIRVHDPPLGAVHFHSPFWDSQFTFAYKKAVTSLSKK